MNSRMGSRQLVPTGVAAGAAHVAMSPGPEPEVLKVVAEARLRTLI